jgi:hypothetical protein
VFAVGGAAANGLPARVELRVDSSHGRRQLARHQILASLFSLLPQRLSLDRTSYICLVQQRESGLTGVPSVHTIRHSIQEPVIVPNHQFHIKRPSREHLRHAITRARPSPTIEIRQFYTVDPAYVDL